MGAPLNLSPLAKYFEEGAKQNENIIPISDITNIVWANEVIDKFISDWDYELPDYDDPDVHYLIGISGGVDSSALAAALAAKHQEAIKEGRMTFLFTDTGNEPGSCYTILDRLEELFGITVIRLDDENLSDAIDENGGFLPSARSRWCTHRMKIQPWERFLKKEFLEKGMRVVGFSGVRWDERERAGVFGVEGVTSAFPFVDQRVERAAVCSIATELNLMNNAYIHGRSRSGCEWCFFMSKQELISLNVWNPKSFREGMAKEKIAEHILERYNSDKPMRTPANGFYTSYPHSSLIYNGKHTFLQTDIFGNQERTDVVGKVSWDYRHTDAAKKKAKSKKSSHEDQLDIFASLDVVEQSDEGVDEGKDKPETSHITEEEITLYVGVESYKNDHLSMFGGGNNGVWQQRLITYSRTLGGLSRSLSGYHYHRQLAARGYFRDEDDYNNQSHITVIAIKFPSGVIPKVEYGKDSYSWASGRSWAEVSYVVRAIERACEYHVQYEVISTGKKGRIREDAEYFMSRYEQDGCPDLGSIVAMGHFQPKPIEESVYDSYDEDVSTVRCAICSI